MEPGAKEQHPEVWKEATATTIRQHFAKPVAKKEEVRAIGVSGQQHGFVPLDKSGNVIRPAIAWCDTSTQKECDEITEALGGLKKTIKTLGNAVLPGFTAPRSKWLKKSRKKNFKNSLPSFSPTDYLNYWLTGEATMEYGDASGTALLNVKKRKWAKPVLEAIDKLERKLPRLISSDQPAGQLQSSTAEELGLSTDVVVSAGGGDNMMGAIGTGNTEEVVTASFGTSGTIYACTEKPVIDPQGEIAAFCDSTNRWLPLLPLRNVTVATEMVRHHYQWTHTQFESAARKIEPGANGLLYPYLEGERNA